MSKPIFALIDCNSFFCSCEIVFRPELQNKPVIVLSNNDGCVVARTPQAKALGIKMGEPFFKIKSLVDKKNVHVFSSNFSLYGDMSARVMNVLSEFSPRFEVYSIDEAFLDLSGFKTKKSLESYAEEIKQQIYKYTGIPVSIGLAPTKVLAKLANYLAKNSQRGVLDLVEENPLILEKMLSKVPASEIWGIGYKSAQKLKTYGINTALDLRNADLEFIQRLLTVQGRNIVEELRGISCLPIDEFAGFQRKSIISSRSFWHPVESLDVIKEALANYISIAAEKLRRQDSVCQTIQVYLQTNPFKNTPQYFNIESRSFLSGTFATNTLIRAGFEILDQIYKPGFEYKKTGVILTNLISKNENQLSFLESKDILKIEKQMATLDRINRKHGSQTLMFAACGTHSQDKKDLQKNRSPSYTTSWNELLTVE